MCEIYVGLCVWSIFLLAARSTPVNQNISIARRSGKLRIISLSHNPRKELKNESRKEVVFPDQYDVVYRKIPKISKEPPCAAGETFCEYIDNYPNHHIRKILKEDGLPSGYFENNSEEEPVIVHRNGGLQEDHRYLCSSLERTITPKVGKNKKDQWRFIINDKEEGYIQAVRVETCRRKDEACDIIGGLPLGYTTSCIQKYIYKRLLSLNDYGAPSPDSFELPSACCCSYKRNLNALARFGHKKTNAITPAKNFELP